MERILIVDDEKNIRESLAMILEDAGYSIQRAKDGNEAMQLLNEREISLVLLDVCLPGQGGLDLLQEMLALKEDLPVIMISGQGTLQVIDESLKAGAIDFIEKPLIKSRILASIKNTLQLKKLLIENKGLQEENKNLWQMVDKKYQMKGKSDSMKSTSKKIVRGAPTDLCVLIQGEKGIGKELSARIIHQNSLRKGMPFVVIDACLTPKDKIERELFGYEEEGKIQSGKIELANQGSLLLNEVEELPLSTQLLLTKVIQEGKLRRIGGQEDIAIDVRIIGTTTKNPTEEIKNKRLDQCFYHCLKEISIILSPLRKRKEDIPALVNYFLEKSWEKGKKKVISQDALKLLMGYDYPGNVEELKRMVESLIEASSGEKIRATDVQALLNQRG